MSKWNILLSLIQSDNVEGAVEHIGSMTTREDFTVGEVLKGQYLTLDYTELPLHLAVHKGNMEMVKAVSNAYPAFRGIADKNKTTVLHVAVMNGNKEIARLLAEQEPLLLVTFNAQGFLSLHLAVINGHFDLVTYLGKLLSEKGDDFLQLSNGGGKCLHLAAEHGHLDIFNWVHTQNPLLIKTATPEIFSVLHIAARHNHSHIAEQILKIYPRIINSLDKNDLLAIHHAGVKGNYEIVNMMLDEMPDLLDRKKDDSLLHWAITNSHEGFAQILIERMSPEQLGITDAQGKTPLELANNKGYTNISELIKDKISPQENNNIINNTEDKADMKENKVSEIDNIADETKHKTHMKENKVSELEFNKVTKIDAYEEIDNIANETKHKTSKESIKNKTPRDILDLNEQQIAAAFDLMNRGNALIKGAERAVLVLGATGAGKSSFTNILAGLGLTIIEDEKGNTLVEPFIQHKDKIPVSHKTISETTVPNRIVTPDGQCTIYDCPGFGDTGNSINNSTAQQIANAFHIKRIFETTKEMKFVLVIPEYDLIGKGEGFGKTVRDFTKMFNGKMFKEDLNKIKDSVTLVVSKVPLNKNKKHILNSISDFIKEKKDIIDTNTILMMKALKESVYLFHQPNLQDGILSKELSNIIFKEINDSTVYMQPNPNHINISITDEARKDAEKLLKLALEKFQSVIETIVEAVKNPIKCITANNENILIQSYGNIQTSLPQSAYYYPSELVQRAKGEYFKHLAQLLELSEILNKIDKDADTEKMAEGFCNMLSSISHFVPSDQVDLLNKISGYIHVFDQQLKYLKFLGEVCDNTPMEHRNSLIEGINTCKETINLSFQKEVHGLILDMKHPYEGYFLVAIKYLDYFKDSPECKNKMIECYTKLGNIFSSQLSGGKDFADHALYFYQLAVKLDPTLLHIYNYVGDIFAKKAVDANSPLEFYKEAIPYYIASFKYLKVVDCFQKLINIAPDDINIRIHRGDYYFSLGMTQKAHKCYLEAMSLTNDKNIQASLASKIKAVHDTSSTKIANDWHERAINYNFSDVSAVTQESLNNSISHLESPTRVYVDLLLENSHLSSNDNNISSSVDLSGNNSSLYN